MKPLVTAVLLFLVPLALLALSGCASPYYQGDYSDSPSAAMEGAAARFLTPPTFAAPTHTSCMPFMGGFNCNSY
jgi:hypothetical protein